MTYSTYVTTSTMMKKEGAGAPTIWSFALHGRESCLAVGGLYAITPTRTYTVGAWQVVTSVRTRTPNRLEPRLSSFWRPVHPPVRIIYAGPLIRSTESMRRSYCT